MGVRLYELTGLRNEVEEKYGRLLEEVYVNSAQIDALLTWSREVDRKLAPKPKKWWQVWR